MHFTQKLGFILVSDALVTFYGCGQKEEPNKTAEAPKAPADYAVTVKIGHAGP